MSEGIIIAFITAIGSLMGGIIGQIITASATIKAAAIKEKLNLAPNSEGDKIHVLVGILGGALIGAIVTLVILSFLDLFPPSRGTLIAPPPPTATSPIVFPLATTPPTETLSRSTISYGQLIYEENFDNTQGWDLEGNRLENGNLIIGSGLDVVPFNGSINPNIFTDFIFEAQFSYPTDSNGIEFYVRQQYPPCPGWNCSIVTVIDRPYNNIVSYRWENGEHGSPLALVSINPKQIQLQPNQWNRITIIANGDEYKVYINDFFIMSFNDGKYKAGTFILNNPGPTEVKIDYIRVYNLP